MTELILTGLLEGLILSFVAFGTMVPLRLLNFADLTSEGTYPLGGAIAACLLSIAIHPVLALVAAACLSGLCGVGTAYIHERFKVNSLLCGIIVSTMLYSINLRLMGAPNIALFQYPTLIQSDSLTLRIVLVATLFFLLTAPLLLFLKTESGLRLRAVGLNPECAKRQGIHTSFYLFLGVFVGNMFSGFAGCLMAQLQSYADIGMGIGIVLHALAALMIGESMVGTHTLQRQFIAPLLGSLVYQQIQGLALSLGLVPSDLKLLTGVIILLVIGIRGNRIAQ